MTPQAFDITLISLMIISTGLAAWRGFVREMLTIAEFAFAGVASWKGGHLLLPVFNDWLDVTKNSGEAAAEIVSQSATADAATSAAAEAAQRKAELIFGLVAPGLMAQICAYGAVFLMMFIVMMLVSFFVTKSIEAAGLGYVNKVTGALFGFTRGFLLIFLPYVICFVAFGKNLDNFPVWAKNSASLPVLDKIYVAADKSFGLGQKIEDRGNAFVLKIGKGETAPDEEAAQELKEEVEQEDKGETGAE